MKLYRPIINHVIKSTDAMKDIIIPKYGVLFRLYFYEQEDINYKKYH